MAGRSILVVDDDIEIQESLAEVLEDAGYSVLCASNGLQALRLLGHDGIRPDLILLDMVMPHLDGWGFRTQQRASPSLADIPVVILTSYAVSRETKDDLGARGTIQKPLHMDELLRAVEDALQNQGLPGR